MYSVLFPKLLNKFKIKKTTSKYCHSFTLFISLPFTGNHSIPIRNRRTKLMHKYHPNLSLRIIFRTSKRISSIFHVKDRVPTLQRSSVVYTYKCDGCTASYVGKTYRHLKARADEHRGISSKTGAVIHTSTHSSIREHCQSTNHPFKYENFNILTTASSKLELLIKETILIKKENPKVVGFPDIPRTA